MKHKTVFESPALGEKYIYIEHESGLSVYVFPKPMSTLYAILGAHYGSIDNFLLREGETEPRRVPDGIAHFLEHKLFEGEDGSDSFERFSEYGADANAYTSFNKTAYLFSCTDRFRESLGELLDFCTHPHFTEESVARERGIIGQEIGMYDDSPAERCYYGMLEGMYHTHSIRRNICGSVESIAKITPDLLYECYENFYALSNMALVVCGDITAEEVMRIVDTHLPHKKQERPLFRNHDHLTEPASVAASRVSRRMQVSKPLFNIGFKDTNIPPDPIARQRKDAAMAILNEILFSRAGELYSSLFEEGLISPEFSYGYTVSESFAYNSLAGEADDPDLVLERVREYLKKTAREGLSKEAFTRGTKVMYAEFVKEFDSVEGIANNLLAAVFDGYDLFSYRELLEAVTFDEVETLFETCFAPEKTTLSVVLPLESNGGAL